MRDRYGTNSIGIRAVIQGCRTVKNISISINGREYWGDCLADLEGQKVNILVRDSFASIYSVYDMEWNALGECHEPTKIETITRVIR